MSLPDEKIKGLEVFLAGYPVEFAGQILNGTQMYYMKGAVGSCDSNKVYYEGMDTTGGQSGAPLVYYYDDSLKCPKALCVGVHTDGDFKKNTNIGVRLTNDKVRWIVDAAK